MLLVETVNDWMLWKNQKCQLDVLYFDMKSEFDSVTHSKLHKLLPSFGVGPRIQGWFAAFLKDIEFRVKVANKFSDWAPVTSDMFTEPMRCKVYADDIKVYSPCSSPEERANLQIALDDLTTAIVSLDLQLSVTKCNVLHIEYGNPRATFMGSPPSVAATVEDLGVLITADMKTSTQVSRVVATCAFKSNMIFRHP